MMEIANRILEELEYKKCETYTVSYSSEGEKVIELTIDFFNKEGNYGQTYLTAHCNDSLLSAFESGDLVKNISVGFRRCENYRPEMDKNTTLLIFCISSNVELNNGDSIISIEDDPYYFKKSVIVYSKEIEDEANCWVKEQGNKIPSIHKGINEYVIDSENYEKYKDSNFKQSLYSLFVTLLSKICVIPIDFDSIANSKNTEFNTNSQNDNFVPSFKRILDNNLSELSKSKREMINFLMYQEDSSLSADAVCSKWQFYVGEGREDM